MWKAAPHTPALDCYVNEKQTFVELNHLELEDYLLKQLVLL